jgi:hypothetical protein
VPLTRPLFVSYVVDRAAVTPGQAALRTNPVLKGTLNSMQATLVSYQSGEPELAKYGIESAARAAGYPCVVVQDAQSGAILGGKAYRVTDGESIVAAVAQFRPVRSTPGQLIQSEFDRQLRALQSRRGAR